MFTEINDKLIELKGELHKKQKYQRQLVDYQKKLDRVEQTLESVRRKLIDEQKDVAKLEGITLTSLFAALSGNKSQRLSKEKEEMLIAQHSLDETLKTRTDIQTAIDEISGKLKRLSSLENEYQRLLKEKERMLIETSIPEAARIFDLSDKEGSLSAYKNELDEAYIAGKQVDRALQLAIQSMGKAENWGTWDMFGGGALASSVKHSYIREFENHIHQAQSSMRAFQKELLDIQKNIHIQVDISSMLTFADFFFDGFIADYMVQGKIQRALEKTRGERKRVQDILRDLNHQLQQTTRELEGTRAEKLQLIESI